MREWSEITSDLSRNWPIYVTMPIIAGLIGYGTKLLAIRMMFRPYTFRGIGPIGWQGIIPRRAPEMCRVLCRTITGQLITSGEIVARLNGKALAKRMDRNLRKEVARIVPVVAEEYQPALWRILPEPVKDVVVQRAQDTSHEVVPKLVDQIQAHIDDIFDLEEMVTDAFMSDPAILESVFLDVGRREFAFIRNSGLVFGLIIGTVQAVIWALFHEPLVMPVFGLFIGWFTDWAALRLIFNPKEPTKYLGIVTWQGLFLKHRIPVSLEYGRLIATKVLTADRLVTYLFTGPRQDKVVDLMAKVIRKELNAELVDVEKYVRKELKRLKIGPLDAVEETVGGLFGAVTSMVAAPLSSVAAVGFDMAQTKAMARAAATELVPKMPRVTADAYEYMDEKLGIENTLGEKMAQMTPTQFEDVLRPAFKADEKTLIAVGAILGFLVGELQVVLIEHLSK